MSFPVFTERPVPIVKTGPYDVPDMTAIPRCRLCPERGPVDDLSGLGLECWRVLVALPVVLEERAENPVRTVVVADPARPRR